MIRVICVVVLAALVGAAQNQTDPDRVNTESIRVDVDLVNVVYTVHNKRGKLITNLKQTNFTILEDDTPQTITNFSQETDLPLTVAVLIDTSGSVHQELEFEQNAAVLFLHGTIRKGVDQAAVTTFSSHIDFEHDYTDDHRVLAEAVHRRRAGGGTRLYDAMYSVIERTLAGREGRRGMVVLTDGEDNLSTLSPTRVIEAAQRHNVSIHFVSVNALRESSKATTRRSDSVMERIATETGGRALFPQKLKHLPDYFKEISNELRSQYTLAFRSTNPKRDGSFRKLRINVNDNNYLVRARAGYYAPVETAARQ